jgi:two-component system sensor histidine kinase UhpB
MTAAAYHLRRWRRRPAFRGMRERAMLIGAQLSIDTPDAGGTELILHVPLDER